jgi:hypothetical protein
MSYTSGGLIEASDFNTRNGAAAANVSGRINTVWSTGNGNAGYGQAAGANVSVGGTVNASNWATLINNLNAARKHQSASGYSNLTVPTSGSTISVNSSLDTTLTAAYTNRLTAALNGTTITGTSDNWNPSAGATSNMDANRFATITWSTADSARYFFNAGGKINYIVSAVDNAGTARSQSIRDLVNNMGGISNFAAYTNSGRTGTGGTISVNQTNYGYWNMLTPGGVNIVKADAAAPYATHFTQISSYVNTPLDTTNGANGRILTLYTRLYAPADDVHGGVINVSVTTRVDIIPPSTVHLSNTWGTPTITYLF